MRLRSTAAFGGDPGERGIDHHVGQAGRSGIGTPSFNCLEYV